MTGVWVTPEFNKALEMSYWVAKIREVWHFDRRSDSIFDYMHTFLQGKQEASVTPLRPRMTKSRRKYIRDYRTHWGILLDADKIKSNQAKSLNCVLTAYGESLRREVI